MKQFILKRSEKTRVIFMILIFALLCVLPFVVAPFREWYIILILFGVPMLGFWGFTVLADKLRLYAEPKRLWTASYFALGFVAFCLSAIVMFLTHNSWGKILSYSAGFSLLAVLVATINIFVWSKIKQLSKSDRTHPE